VTPFTLMRKSSFRKALGGAIVAALVAGAAHTTVARAKQPKPTHPPFGTAIADAELPWAPDPDLAYDHVRAVGARSFRFFLSWADVAPNGSRPPAGFDPADPFDRHYRWDFVDRNVRLIVKHGLRPIVCVQTAPPWAEDPRVEGAPGTRRPDPHALALFARALAKRYSGKFFGLPRVRNWQIWNEPNIFLFLNPQYVDGKAVSPSWYRQMLNQAAAAIRAVQPRDVVVGGSLAPWGHAGGAAVAPFAFMQDLLCMSADKIPKPTCRSRTSFDVWAHHPYGAGGPDWKAPPDTAAVAELPQMHQLLLAATRAGHVNTGRRQPGFWVTEFGWDSNPPDPAGVPEALHVRWVAEALYRMWRADVSLATWYPLRDQPLGVSVVQTGLYFYDGGGYRLGEPKPAMTAFRFPFVAYRSRNRVLVWGRAPDHARRTVVVEQGDGTGGWTQVAVLRCDGSGVFTARLHAAVAGDLLRARAGGEESIPFSLTRPPDFKLSNPFGS
jgi:hypothetical protein